MLFSLEFISVQFSSVAQSYPTFCDPVVCNTPCAGLPCPSPTPGTYLKSCIELVMPSNHLILCHPHLFPPSIFPRNRVFSIESVLCIRMPKNWSFSFFSITPSNEYPGHISFRIGWLHLLAVQGTLKSLLQHHNLKSSVLWHSASFMIQLSHPQLLEKS